MQAAPKVRKSKEGHSSLECLQRNTALPAPLFQSRETHAGQNRKAVTLCCNPLCLRKCVQQPQKTNIRRNLKTIKEPQTILRFLVRTLQLLLLATDLSLKWFCVPPHTKQKFPPGFVSQPCPLPSLCIMFPSEEATPSSIAFFDSFPIFDHSLF